MHWQVAVGRKKKKPVLGKDMLGMHWGKTACKCSSSHPGASDCSHRNITGTRCAAFAEDSGEVDVDVGMVNVEAARSVAR